MHHRKGLTCLAFTILILITANIIFVFEIENCTATGNTIWVDDSYFYPEESDGSMEKPYISIQAGINAAEEGDTVFVRKGSYSGFTVDKGLTIKGEGISNTFIHGAAKDNYLIELTANNCSLENFKIWDTTPTTHRKAVIHVASSASHVKIVGVLINLSRNGYGVKVEGNNAILEGNKINNTKGIYLTNSDVNTIFDNIIYNCKGNYIIYITNSNYNHIEQNSLNDSNYGIFSRESSNNKFINNTIFDNTHKCIEIISGSEEIIKNNTIYDSIRGIDISSSDFKIISNTIYNNDIGINIKGDNGLIQNNTIKKTSIYGINAEAGSSGNTFFDNNFTNKNSGYYAKESGNNRWYNEELQSGNYWEDFLGPNPNNESTLESLEDSVFYYTKGGVLDKYPTGRYQKIPVISDPSPAHLESGVDLQPTLSVHVVDSEEKNMDVYFYYMKNNQSYFIDSVKNVYSDSDASIPFYSTIQGRNAVYSYLGTGFNFICNWYVIVKDEYSQARAPKAENDSYIFTTIDTPLDNEAPIAIAEAEGNNQEYEVNNSIPFYSIKSYDPDGNITFFRWTFGDGESIVNVENPTHTYSKSKSYEVTLTIIDNNGSSDTDTIHITTVEEKPNSKPLALISAPSEGKTGEQITFTSNSMDPDGDTLSFLWSVEKKNFTGATLKYTFNEPGTYPLTLFAVDEEGAFNATTRNIKITLTEEETPGFEFITFFITLLIIVVLFRKKYKK